MFFPGSRVEKVQISQGKDFGTILILYSFFRLYLLSNSCLSFFSLKHLFDLPLPLLSYLELSVFLGQLCAFWIWIFVSFFRFGEILAIISLHFQFSIPFLLLESLL